MKLTTFLLGLCLMALTPVRAQNPASVFRIPNRDTLLPCNTDCIRLTATVPHLKATNDYAVTSVPYLPFAYSTPDGAEPTVLYNDDRFTPAIPLDFPFCFYGSNFKTAVIGSNGVLTFDSTNAGRANSWALTTSSGSGTPVPIPYNKGTQGAAASTYFARASVFGPFHDLFARNAMGGARKIEYRMEGTAPKRRFIVSFKDVSMFQCTGTSATHMIVIYENTGVVEVYMQDKPVCPTWNRGLAVLGLQNWDRDAAVTPPGRNTSQWGGTGINEAWRFVPFSGTSRFRRAELLLNGAVIATADTASGAPGDLQLSFPEVCVQGESARYTMRVIYGSCIDPMEEVSFEEDVNVRRYTATLGFAGAAATCASGGTLTPSFTGGVGPVTYAFNGGAFGPERQFSDLLPGSYSLQGRDSLGCTLQMEAVVTQRSDLSYTPLRDTLLCGGGAFTAQLATNATSVTWAQAPGLSDPQSQSPRIAPPATQTYTLEAALGTCTVRDTMTVTVAPNPVVAAGADQTIITGDITRLSGNANGGTATWSPATGLSSSTALMVQAAPLTTTTYTLTAVSALGCTATDEVTINVVPFCVKPMESFTPNGDGVNDRWLIVNGNCLKQARVEVFNRYGHKVYVNGDYRNTWDGYFNGRPLPDGTYYYVVSYELLNGKTMYLRGSVTILR